MGVEISGRLLRLVKARVIVAAMMCEDCLGFCLDIIL